MSFDYSNLNGKIIEKFGTQYKFSEAMGYSERTISLKLNGKRPWNDQDIFKASQLLDIDTKDISKYFFNPEVHV